MPVELRNHLAFLLVLDKWDTLFRDDFKSPDRIKPFFSPNTVRQPRNKVPFFTGPARETEMLELEKHGVKASLPKGEMPNKGVVLRILSAKERESLPNTLSETSKNKSAMKFRRRGSCLAHGSAELSNCGPIIQLQGHRSSLKVSSCGAIKRVDSCVDARVFHFDFPGTVTIPHNSDCPSSVTVLHSVDGGKTWAALKQDDCSLIVQMYPDKVCMVKIHQLGLLRVMHPIGSREYVYAIMFKSTNDEPRLGAPMPLSVTITARRSDAVKDAIQLEQQNT